MVGAMVGRKRMMPRTGDARVIPARFAARALAFVLLVLAAIATLGAAFQVPYHTTIAVGDASAERLISGFHAAEGTGDFTYRWTMDRASVRLPLGVFPGEADVVLSGPQRAPLRGPAGAQQEGDQRPAR